MHVKTNVLKQDVWLKDTRFHRKPLLFTEAADTWFMNTLRSTLFSVSSQWNSHSVAAFPAAAGRGLYLNVAIYTFFATQFKPLRLCDGFADFPERELCVCGNARVWSLWIQSRLDARLFVICWCASSPQGCERPRSRSHVCLPHPSACHRIPGSLKRQSSSFKNSFQDTIRNSPAFTFLFVIEESWNVMEREEAGTVLGVWSKSDVAIWQFRFMKKFLNLYALVPRRVIHRFGRYCWITSNSILQCGYNSKSTYFVKI